jgi:hypothetical protein
MKKFDWLSFFAMTSCGLIAMGIYTDHGFTKGVFITLVSMFIFAMIYLKD